MLTLETLAALLQEHRQDVGAPVAEFTLGDRSFAFNRQPSIMGVINLSRDSWYRESVCLSADAAIQRARVLCAQGADIIDLGAESTLTQAERVSEQDQSAQLLPIIKTLRSERILVSVETYHPEVTRACLEAGANILNLTGTDRSKEIYRMVAAHEAAAIICFVAGPHVRAVRDFDLGSDSTGRMKDYFAREIDIATGQGVRKLFIDPGLGFYYRNLQDSAVRVRHQMTTFLHTFRLRSLGFPICHALPHAFEYFGEEVRSAEPFFAVLAALGKTDLFRTHEVSRVKAVLETLKVYPG